MTRKAFRSTGPLNPPSRRQGASGYDSRSLSPLSRGRQTPPLPEPPRSSPYKPALIFSLTYCMGHSVFVQTRNGDTFEGILHTPGLSQSEVHFVLKKARKLNAEKGTGDFIDRLVIRADDVAQMHAKDLPIQQQEMPPRPSVSPVLAFPIHAEAEQVTIQFGDLEDIGFLGDKDRERDGAGLFGRELQKWEPDEGTSLTDFEETDHQIGTWDQFEENEKRFGVKTDFNMDLYTTRLEPGKSRYSLAEAEKIARDIQNQTSSNIHLQDERGHLAIDDSGISDELLYSSVLADAPDSNREANGRVSEKERLFEKQRMRSKSKSPEPIATKPVIIRPGATPLIITNSRNRFNPQVEFGRVAKDLASPKPVPRGSPLNTSPLLHDHEGVKALGLLPGLSGKVLSRQTRNQYIQYKKLQEFKANNREERDKVVADLRAFKESIEKKIQFIPMRTETDSIEETLENLQQSSSATPMGIERSAFGSTLLPDDLEITQSEEVNPDIATQKELPQLRITMEDDDDAEEEEEENSGPGLNPHAVPFNPTQALKHRSESSLQLNPSDSEESEEPSPRESLEMDSITPRAEIKHPSFGDLDEFPPLRPPETVVPPVVTQTTQPMVLIRNQPPPPPRLATPPPPPPQHPVPHPTTPMRPWPPNRNLSNSASPANLRTPQSSMQQDPPNMVINNPPIMMGSLSGAQSSGPQSNSNGMQGPPHMMPMTSGVHMMPQPLQYYPSEVGGRYQVFMHYPHQMAPVPGPPAPPGQNPSANEGMPPHLMYAPYFHPMAQYPMAYAPAMMQPGMPPQYIPVQPTPMTAPRGTSGGRSSRRGRRSSFFNHGPRRG